jgi:hypothetical protein
MHYSLQGLGAEHINISLRRRNSAVAMRFNDSGCRSVMSGNT